MGVSIGGGEGDTPWSREKRAHSYAPALSFSPRGFRRETGPHLLPASFLLDSGGELIATAEKTTDTTVRAASPRRTRTEDWRAGALRAPLETRQQKKFAAGLLLLTTQSSHV